MSVRRFTVALDTGLNRVTKSASVVLASDYDALAADLADSRAIAREQEDAHVAANMRNTHLQERIRELVAALRDMVDRWEPDGGSDKRMWDRARELLGYESETFDEQCKHGKGEDCPECAQIRVARTSRDRGAK